MVLVNDTFDYCIRDTDAAMIETITNDVFNKLNTPSRCFDDFPELEAHIGNEFNIRM